MRDSDRKVLILDGGFSTQLANNVKENVDGDPLWTSRFLVTNPQAVLETHLDFLRAGAEVLSTNTYQVSVQGFQQYLGLGEKEIYDLMKSAVKLAKEAVSVYIAEEKEAKRGAPKILIAGSVGPYGAFLHDGSEFSGDYVESVTREQLAQWHRPRIETLMEAGVDLFAFETIPALMEAEVLLEMLKEYPQMKAWVSFTCKDKLHTSHGEKFEEVVAKCWSINPVQTVAIGINCTNPEFVTSLISNINANRPDDKIPLIIYPNRGEQFDVEKGWIGTENCKPLEEYAPQWIDLGAVYIGGCCRTRASDIAKLTTVVSKWVQEKHLQ